MIRLFSRVLLLSAVFSPLLSAMEGRVLLESDFEGEDWAKPWRRANDATVKIVSPGDPGFVPRDGRALRVSVPKGAFLGTELSYFFKDHLEAEPEEAYFRYDLRFSENWETRQGGKLPGFAGTYGKSGWGGRPSDGTTGWSARGLFQQDRDGKGVPVGNYVYHAGMTGQYGDNWRWDGHRNGLIKPGQWVRIEQAMRLNTPGKSDGELRAWVDGRLVMHRKGIEFRRNGDLKIERIWMNIYHGGKIAAHKDLHVDFDNVLIHAGPLPVKRPGVTDQRR